MKKFNILLSAYFNTNWPVREHRDISIIMSKFRHVWVTQTTAPTKIEMIYHFLLKTEKSHSHIGQAEFSQIWGLQKITSHHKNSPPLSLDQTLPRHTWSSLNITIIIIIIIIIILKFDYVSAFLTYMGYTGFYGWIYFYVYLSLVSSLLRFDPFRSLLVTSFHVFLGCPLAKLTLASNIYYLLGQ